jgi:hypothetical protein
MIRTEELKAWLMGRRERTTPTAGVASRLGLEPARMSSAGHDALRFALATLRDLHADEVDVWLWFLRPRPELAGVRPIDLLSAEQTSEFENAVAGEWNRRQATRVPDLVT